MIRATQDEFVGFERKMVPNASEERERKEQNQPFWSNN